MYIQQSSFNLIPNKSEILIIWHLRTVVPRPEILLFTRKCFISEISRFRDVFKKAFKSVCLLAVMVSPDPLFPTPSTSSATKTPENTEEDPDDPEPADGNNQVEYFSDQLYSPSMGAGTKNYL
jgi:hypothetical protein